MTIWEAGILGIVQGLTEFLPVSSSGHLVLLQQWLGVAEAGVGFEVAVHLGTALAVIIYFRKHLWAMAKNLRLLGLIVVASIPAAIAGIGLEDYFTELFSDVRVVGYALLATGILLWFSETRNTEGRTSKGLERMTMTDALIIGLGQALAIIPGLSRSGTTISVALFRNVKRETAAEFSFLMSLPVILGAAILQLPEWSAGSGDFSVLFTGVSFALLAGLAAIYSLLALIRRKSLKYFAYYVWVVGLIVILLNLG